MKTNDMLKVCVLLYPSLVRSQDCGSRSEELKICLCLRACVEGLPACQRSPAAPIDNPFERGDLVQVQDDDALVS